MPYAKFALRVKHDSWTVAIPHRGIRSENHAHWAACGKLLAQTEFVVPERSEMSASGKKQVHKAVLW